MSFETQLNAITDSLSGFEPIEESAVQESLRAIQIRGGYPTSLNLLRSIQEALEQKATSSSSVASMIAVDHVLSLRLISIANFEHFGGEQQLLSVPEAVEHLGLGKVGEIIENLAEPKNFNAIFLGRAISLTMMQQAVLASVIAKRVTLALSNSTEDSESAYVLSALTNIGPLLCAFYHPQVFSALCIDCLDDRDLFERGFERIYRAGLNAFEESAVERLSLPGLYAELSEKLKSNKLKSDSEQPDSSTIASGVIVGNLLAHEICFCTGVQGLQGLLREIHRKYSIPLETLEDILGDLQKSYYEHTDTLQLKPVRLPEYLDWFLSKSQRQELGQLKENLPSINERINPFLYELRATLRNSQCESSRVAHAVYITLNALVKGLNFDRASLFIAKNRGDQHSLEFRLCFGSKLFDSQKSERVITEQMHQIDFDEMPPEVRSFLKREAVFDGQPSFEDAWPFVAFPIIYGGAVRGVFYADKIRRPEEEALTKAEMIASVALASEWGDIPADFS